jgi:hypothetical protein
MQNYKELAILLAQRDEFEQLFLDILAGDRWENVGHKLVGIQTISAQVLQDPWLRLQFDQAKLDELEPSVLFVLVSLAVWKDLYKSSGKKRNIAVPLLIGFARYFYPAFLSMTSKSPFGFSSIDSDDSTTKWLKKKKPLTEAIEKLGLDLDREVLRELYTVLGRHQSTIARNRQKGLLLVHNAFCRSLGITRDVPIISIHEEAAASEVTPQRAQNKDELLSNYPPCVSAYWQFQENVSAAFEARELYKKLPGPTEIADILVSKKLIDLPISSDQKILAKELLSYLPYWGMTMQEKPAAYIDRRLLESLWKKIYTEYLSPIISCLLDAGLLSLNNAGQLGVCNSLLQETFLAKTALREEPANELPPTEMQIPLSRWLYTQFMQMVNAGLFTQAGEILWRIQGFLPGAFSNSWSEIMYICSSACSDALSEPRIWTLATIAQRVVENVDTEKNKNTRAWLSSKPLKGILAAEPRGKDADYFQRVANLYITGLTSLLEWRNLLPPADPEYIFWDIENVLYRGDLNMNWKHFASSRIYYPEKKDELDWSYRQMVLSTRSLDPKISMGTKNLVDGKGRTTVEGYFMRSKKSSMAGDPNVATSFAEPLVAWKNSQVDGFLERYQVGNYMFRNQVYKGDRPLQNRISILRYAMANVPGYEDWV